MPAGSDPLPPLPLRLRPTGIRVAAVAVGLVLLVVATAVWLTLPQAARDSFTFAQRLTLLLMGAMTAAAGHALARSRVDADDAGLTVVNGYRTHRLDWAQVVGVGLGPGDPWAVLDLSDGTTRSAMGIQGSDGARAQRQVRQLRALVAARSGQEPGRLS